MRTDRTSSAAIASLSCPAAASPRMWSSRGDNTVARSSERVTPAVTRSGAMNAVSSRRSTDHAGSSSKTMWLLLCNATNRAPRILALGAGCGRSS